MGWFSGSMSVKTFAAKPDNFEFDSQDPHGGKKRTNTLLKVATDLTCVMWHTHALTHTHITDIHTHTHVYEYK